MCILCRNVQAPSTIFRMLVILPIPQLAIKASTEVGITINRRQTMLNFCGKLRFILFLPFHVAFCTHFVRSAHKRPNKCVARQTKRGRERESDCELEKYVKYVNVHLKYDAHKTSITLVIAIELV